jgi:hypothetical protein
MIDRHWDGIAKHGDASTHPLRGPELRAIRAWKRAQGETLHLS